MRSTHQCGAQIKTHKGLRNERLLNREDTVKASERLSMHSPKTSSSAEAVSVPAEFCTVPTYMPLSLAVTLHTSR